MTTCTRTTAVKCFYCLFPFALFPPLIHHVCRRWSRAPVTRRNASWESHSLKDQRWLPWLTYKSQSQTHTHANTASGAFYTICFPCKICVVSKSVWKSILYPLDQGSGAFDSWIHPSFTITWCNLSKQGQSWSEGSNEVRVTAAHLLHVNRHLIF